MTLSDLITRIGDDANLATSISTVSSRIVREINRVCQEAWESFPWSFRWRNYRFVTDTDYTTGTLTATNGSRSITGAGTVFTSSHVDWHIQFTGDSAPRNWYRIRAFTSATALELDVPYQGTTGGSKAYILRRFDYVLPTELWDFDNAIVTADDKPIPVVSPHSLDLAAAVPSNTGSPQAVSIYGSDSMPTTYNTGTISGTVNTTTVTGSGTSWLSNVYPGDLITIGSYVYTVRNVVSDTSITLYNQQQVTSAAGTSYTITRQFGRIIRIMWPSNYNYVIDVRALRKYAPLVHNSDTNELLYRCSHAIALKVSALELKSQNDRRSALLEQDAAIALINAKGEDEVLTYKQSVEPVYSYRNTRGNRTVFE